jgi:DNA-directed RNA polymerase subunit E'
MQIGPTQGMIHISQTMEDFVSLSKTGNLQGKMTKRSLNVGDSCLARIVAISYKGGEPKIGLTMRQPGLGKVEWLDEAKKKATAAARKAEKGESGKKGKKEKKE